MNITKRTKILVIGAAVAVAGGLTTSAFTAGGLTNSVPEDNFIGGSEKITISGAVITNMSYDLQPITDLISSVTLWFTGDVLTRKVELVFNPASGPALPTYTCSDIADVSGNYQSVCTPTASKADADDVDTVDLTVDQ